MAIDNRGRKLPKGIRQRGEVFEYRFNFNYEEYVRSGFKTVTECQKAMEDLRYKLKNGIYVERVKVILNDWYDTWLETYKKNQLKRETYLNYKIWYDKVLRPHKIGFMSISSIRPEHIQALYNELMEYGYSKSSMKHIKTQIKGSLDQAVKNGLIERNPVHLVDLPKMEVKAVEKAMTRSEQTIFMEQAEGSYLFNLFSLMLITGMRVGEVQGLKYGDIDRKNNIIHISRTLKFEKGIGFYENSPKTKTSKRSIPLLPIMIKHIDNQRGFWGEQTSVEDYIFKSCNFQPLKREQIRTEIDRILRCIRRTGIEFPHVTPHSFRHTFATRAIEEGMSPQVLKTILGHSSLAMTMDLYSHVLPDTKVSAMESIMGAFN